MLAALYAAGPLDPAPGRPLVRDFAARYAVPPERVEGDLGALLESVQCLLRDQPGRGPAVRRTPFGTPRHQVPGALRDRPDLPLQQPLHLLLRQRAGPRPRRAGDDHRRRSSTVIDKIVDQAQVPTVSFTGGEPTLRPDLPELIAYARSRGMRVNLITNGIRCADAGYVATLEEAGLDSAQVSLEAADAGGPRSHRGQPRRLGAHRGRASAT